MIATLISHPSCQQHLMPAGHPECPARIDAIANQLMANGIDGLLYHREAPAATDEQLLRVHSLDHLHAITRAIPDEGIYFFADDVYLSPQTLSAARHAAGAAAMGVDMVMRGETDAVFCNVRPPGHHAERARAMGFCIFNNVAIAAAHALAVYGLERVAVIDFDVHHGNGTQDIFLDDSRVLFCSSFQFPFYPNTNIDDVPAHIINTPLPATCRSEGFRSAISEQWFPALEKFKPQLMLISAGFDAYIDDDMSSISLVEQDYSWITQKLRALMDDSKQLVPEQQCKGIVSTLEGGYDLLGLGRCAVAHIKALAKL
ncbi:MAG: histone deacetylase family protein [Cellvibrio sp.]|uniref:histone deacetylase family protein n=1 Tax=Cellvibrio sp. TaxID=1965322 RepID=UPI0027272ED7|nr:histone deacetylase family protein [Cellvibrio sp.]